MFHCPSNLLLFVPFFPESDDLFAVKSKLVPVAARWKDLGLALGLDPNKLDIIEGENKKMEQCLSQVLHLWLNQLYDTKKFGEPSWQLLATAVADPNGGNSPALADKIANLK